METEEEKQVRRESYYRTPCWCGHTLGNHSPITGDCMLCDHIKVRREIREYEARRARS